MTSVQSFNPEGVYRLWC